MSFDARVIAKLFGEQALGGLLLVFAVLMAWAPIPTWFKAALTIPALASSTFMVLAASIRRLQGGASDVEIADGVRRFSVTSIRFKDLKETISAALGWQRPAPLVLPAGSVVGSATDMNALRPGAASSLPAGIEVTSTPQEVPSDAAGLEIRVVDPARPDDDPPPTGHRRIRS